MFEFLEIRNQFFNLKTNATSTTEVPVISSKSRIHICIILFLFADCRYNLSCAFPFIQLSIPIIKLDIFIELLSFPHYETQRFYSFSFQTILSLCVSMSYFCIGLVRGYSSPAVPSIEELNPELLPTKHIASWTSNL